MVQKGGEALEGSAFEEKAVAVYRSPGKKKETIIELKALRAKDGTEAVEITSSAWPGFALRGSMPDDSQGTGSGQKTDNGFELTGARVLSSHVHGWNEFTLDILGSAFFPAGSRGGVLRVDGEAERVQISSGRIRLKSNYLTGAAALTSLRNRRERITALTEWMDEWIEAHGPVVFNNQEGFADFWKPVLLPELVSRKKRPPDYSAKNAEWTRADSVKWNLGYTKYLFPEGLWEYRNSGALLRDWEEALHWIFIEYSWNIILGSFDGIALQKIK